MQDVNQFISKKLQEDSPRSLLFLKLFLEPNQISANSKKRCMVCFGAEVVERAVASKVRDKSLVFSMLNEFDGECFKHLRPKKAPKPKAKHPNANQLSEGTFLVGDRVVVCGLVKMTEYNGKFATVTRLKDQGRYAVKVDELKSVRLLPANMKLHKSTKSNESSDSDSDASMPGLLTRQYKSGNEESESDAKSSSGSEATLPPLNRPRTASSGDSSIGSDNHADPFSDADSSDDSSVSVAPHLLSDHRSSSSSDNFDSESDNDSVGMPNLVQHDRQHESSSSSSDDSMPPPPLFQRDHGGSSSSSDDSMPSSSTRQARERQRRAAPSAANKKSRGRRSRT